MNHQYRYSNNNNNNHRWMIEQRCYSFLIFMLVVALSSSSNHLFTLALAAPQSTQRASIVTGANGYVGREVVQVLLKDDPQQQIYCLVRPNRVETERAYYCNSKENCIHVLPYDMCDGGKSMTQAMQQAAAAAKSNDNNNNDNSSCEICVYHIASVFGPSDHHVQTAKDNVQGTAELVTAMASFLPNIICRLVLTSSMAAVRGTGQDPLNGKYYTYKDWNTQSKLVDVDHPDYDPTNWGVSYQWSKAESERRAWELAKQHGLPMTSICPSFVFGPPSSENGASFLSSSSYSITLVGQWVRGESPVQSRLCVDIRDVAQAHVAAGTRKEAIGQRFLVSSEARKSSRDMAQALEQVCRDTGLGDASLITFDADFKGGAVPIGAQEVEAVERLRKSLGVHLRPVEETIADMGLALLMAGVESTSKEEVPESTK